MQRMIYFNFPQFEQRFLPKRTQLFNTAEKHINNFKELIEERVQDVRDNVYQNPHMENGKDLLTAMVEGLVNSDESILSADILVVRLALPM